MSFRFARARAVTAAFSALALVAAIWVATPALAISFTLKKPAVNSSSTATKPKISVYITDTYGIKGASSFSMKVDGKTVRPKVTYRKARDYKHVTLSYQVTTALKVGSHTVTVKIKNVRKKSYTSTWKFTVKAAMPPTPPPPPPPAPMPVTIAASDCGACHVGYPATHPMTDCGSCHGASRPLGDPAYGSGDTSAHAVGCALEIPCHGGSVTFPHRLGSDCGACHAGGYSGIASGHSIAAEPAHGSTSARCTVSGCHLTSLTVEHYLRTVGGVRLSCATCHSSVSARVVGAIRAGSTSCESCHTLTTAHSVAAAKHTASGSCIAANCHGASAVAVHGAAGGPGCDACHAAGRVPSMACASCHPGSVSQVHAMAAVAHTATAGTCVTAICHLADVTAVHGGTGSPGCAVCHAPGRTASSNCVTCHPGALDVIHPRIGTAHMAPVDGCVNAVCHARDVTALHGVTGGPDCGACHEAGAAATIGCAACHSGDLTGRHSFAGAAHTASAGRCVTPACHAANVATLHAGGPGCAACHGPGKVATTACSPCHASEPTVVHPLAMPAHTAPASSCVSASCHSAGAAALHAGLPGSGCPACHVAGKSPTLACPTCHTGDLVSLHQVADPAHAAPVSTCVQSKCHAASAASLHRDLAGSGCSACHAPGVTASLGCATCHAGDLTPRHPSANAKHTAPASSCVTAGCHLPNAASVHGATGGPGCAACHAPGKVPSLLCANCHAGSIPALHAAAAAAHAAPGSTCVQTGCHITDAATLHTQTGGPGCAACHATGITPSIECARCHPGDLTPRHPSANSKHTTAASSCVTGGCHIANASAMHSVTGGPGCAACHAPGKVPSLGCANCHVGSIPALHAAATAAHAAPRSTCVQIGCHVTDTATLHTQTGGPGCAACHATGVTVSIDCARCHPGDLTPRHPSANAKHTAPAGLCVASACHVANVASTHASGLGCVDCHGVGVTPSRTCATCHSGDLVLLHPAAAPRHLAPVTTCTQAACHVRDAATVHGEVGGPGCAACHRAGTTPTLTCPACHPGGFTIAHPAPAPAHTAVAGTCVSASCHLANAAAVHTATGGPGCAACHAPGRTASLDCSTCHLSDLVALHPAAAPGHAASVSACGQAGCHVRDSATVHGALGGPGCAACHAPGKTASIVCARCHPGDALSVHPTAAAKHAAPAGACVLAGCHTSDAAGLHGLTGTPGCPACHGPGRTTTLACATCHTGDVAALHPGATAAHTAPVSSCIRTGCHSAEVTSMHGKAGGPGCAACHAAGKTASVVCTNCHPSSQSVAHAAGNVPHQAPIGACVQSGCHVTNVVTLHNIFDPGCAPCHGSGVTPTVACGTCHSGDALSVHAPLVGTRHIAPAGACATTGCHGADAATLHGVLGSPGCGACHIQGRALTLDCATCHGAFTSSHPVPEAAHTAALGGPCSGCHVPNVATLHGAEGGPSCAACHAVAVSPSLACANCHLSDLAAQHSSAGTAHTPTIHPCTGDCHGTNVAAIHATSERSCAVCHALGEADTNSCTDSSCHPLPVSSVHVNYAMVSEFHRGRVGTGWADWGWESNGWLLAPYSRGASLPCSACHVPEGTTNDYNFPYVVNGTPVTVTSDSQLIDLCVACHGGTLGDWHQGCFDCHGSGMAGLDGPRNVQQFTARYGGDCTQCHQHGGYGWPHGPGWMTGATL